MNLGASFSAVAVGSGGGRGAGEVVGAVARDAAAEVADREEATGVATEEIWLAASSPHH